ncbi:MAG: FHA domain-containing protein [Pseudomonadales bacterium]
MELAVTILGRPAQPVQRLHLGAGPATLGRSFACDLVLADPRVEAVHLEVGCDETGALVVCDLGSLNGTSVNGQTIDPGVPIALESGDTLILGHTRLRVFRQDHDVGPARSPSNVEQLRDRLSTPRWLLGFTAIGLSIFLLFDYLHYGGDYSTSITVRRIMDFGLQAGLWMLFWGTVNKLVRGEFSFWPHWCVGVATVAVMPLLDELLGFVGFNWQSMQAHRFLDALFNFAVVVASLYFALGLATFLRRRARTWIALLPATLMLVTTYALPLMAEDRSVAVPELLNISRPPAFKLAEDSRATVFIDATAKLYPQAQRVAAEQLAKEARESTVGLN